MVTRDDGAYRAGISSAVVSYVVNGGPRRVAPATRLRVLEAIEELGYRPNGLARALRVRRAFTIGMIVPDNTNPFFAQLARAVEEAAFARGYVLLLGNSTENDNRQAAYVRTFLERQVEGLFLIAGSDIGEVSLPKETAKVLECSRTPLVLLDRKPTNLWARSLTVDNLAGGYLATKHLLWHGHEAVSCLAGPSDLMTAKDRTKGWAKALRETGVEPRPEFLVRSRFRRDAGYRAGLKLLTGPNRPSALFTESDEQAVGALRAAFEIGLKVPDDLAIVSFDGIDESSYTPPPLTTIEQPIKKLGQRAVELLLDPKASSDVISQPECLPVRLVVRQSCGCPRKRASG